MAHDWIDLQVRAHAEFGRRLEAVTDWNAPTPDTEWDVATLVKHVIAEQQWVPYLLKGMTIQDAALELRAIKSDDLPGEWERYSQEATDAWAAAPMESTVMLSYDTVTTEDYLKEQVSDVTIHTWDLARAVGADEKLDDALVEAAWSIFEPQKETLAATGLFADPVLVDANAPLQARLLAITGRDGR
ncbi:MAG: hypothetical protein QOI02_1429 [Actinomycetota bacterium]|jgi:uncharacterized protein (TIGR03086 family)|nr:hypothetical protein [Glaciihabitans sp.]MDQ1556427.1 hypothetical protein [Actinomycetota bacterium]